jgi:hypothetical protein
MSDRCYKLQKFTFSGVRKSIRHADTQFWMVFRRFLYTELRTSHLLWYDDDDDNDCNNNILYGCETLSFMLREKRRLREFENRMLRGYLGLRRTR